MNIIAINSYEDYVNKVNIILRHGKKKEVGDQKYTELCPCVIEIKTSCIEKIACEMFDRKNPHNKVNFNYSHFKYIMKQVIYGDIDFNEIPGSDYASRDYLKEKEAFIKYANDRKSDEVTRRQYLYYFEENSCCNEIQIFEDEKIAIINFRSCDYIKKFPFDVLMFKILMDDFDVKCDKFYCIFGSLHIYDGDKI